MNVGGGTGPTGTTKLALEAASTRKVRSSAVVVTVGVLLAAGLAGCGSHAKESTGAGGTPATPGQSTSAPSGGNDRGTGDGSSDTSEASPSGGSSPAAVGKLPKGSYDDTSGTPAKKPKNQAAVLKQFPGVAAGRCVKVGTRTDVRSGRTAMGNFALARKNFGAAKSAYDADPSFFYIVPFSRSARSVTVVATRLGAHSTPVRVRTQQREEAAQWNYFPIEIQIPASGTWRFRVTTGSEHGCFDASFAT
jgi:hypothetical protein